MARKKPADSTISVAPDAVANPAAELGPVPTEGPGPEWQGGLYQRVITAIYALSDLFRTALNVTGVRATDLYTLNSALGASIEQSVVDNLNSLRTIWDPDQTLRPYAFVRQPQVFPDVRLQTAAPNVEPKVLMGIELKGWFALAKEGEPSFRYAVTPEACALADLLVVFPWILDEIISGKPKLLRPFVVQARYAAEHRNHYWRVLRRSTGVDPDIRMAAHVAPYPNKADKFNDSAAADAGGNFGRVARGGIMALFIGETMQQPVAGIPLGAWQRFLKIFSDNFSEATLNNQLSRIETDFTVTINGSPEARAAFRNFVESIARLIGTLDRHE